MTDSPNLNLPYLLAAQAQKHVTHNEALRALDALVQLSVLDRNLATPPTTPDDGARYIVDTGPTGAWTGKAGQIAAYQDGAWMFYPPKEGWRAWVADEDVLVVYTGTAWTLVSSGGGGGTASVNPTPLVGVNATADTTNRLSVNSTASLFNHPGSGGHQLKINKAAASDTASVLFQTGFSGRAEFGTTGDDKFHVKVSSNGTAWNDAITLDNASGKVGVGQTAPQSRLHVGNTFGASVPASGIQIGVGGRFAIVEGNRTFYFDLVNGYNYGELSTYNYQSGVAFPLVFNANGGNVGIGTVSPSYQLHLSSDSAAKPGTNTWTISSDVRLKENIVAANLDRCWEIVKQVPLKRYTWKGDAYSNEQVTDRSQLGWIAQDVQPFFKNAVKAHVFHRPPVEDGVEDYQEQETIERRVVREVAEIVVRDGRAMHVKKSITETVREPVFETCDVVDEAGRPVLDGDGHTLTHQVPRMVTKSRPKMRTETIDDCLSLNADQIYAAMYGALQHAIAKIEALEADIKTIKAAPGKAY